MHASSLPRLGGALFLLAATAIRPPSARADQRDFPFTYEWNQTPEGQKEIEVKNTYNGAENSFKQEFELEYGVSKRFMVAPYVIGEHASGGSYRYQGFQVESRYQLGEFKTGEWLPGLYLEYDNEKGEDRELEGKLILSRYGKDGSNISFNYIVKKPLVAGAEFGNSYSLGYARDLGGKRSSLRGGGEFIHDLSAGQLKAGPTVSTHFGAGFGVCAGYVFALNTRRGNKGDARINVEYEF